jgi:protein-tyrosine phosphatase
MKVLFVCSGNTCRSPMCEGYMKKLCREAGLDDVEALSAGVFAGTGEGASSAAKTALREHGVDLESHRSRPLDANLIEEADLIVALGTSHRRSIGAIAPKALAKTKLLLEYADKPDADVADPFGGPVETYSACFEEMKPALDNLLLELIELRKGKAKT